MTFWNVGFFNVGFFSTNFWCPAGFTGPITQSFTIPTSQLFVVQAGQTTGGGSGAGRPFTATSK